MTQIATTCLARGTFAIPGWSNPVVCPSGSTMIVKQLAINTAGSSADMVQVAVQTGDGLLTVVIWKENPTAPTALLKDTWTVLNPGDRLTVYSATAGATYWVSGSMLGGDSPWTPPAGTVVDLQPLPVLPF